MVTKADCVNARYGAHFRYLRAHYKSRDRAGEPLQVRASGACQTWKTRPAEFRLPIKFGMYENGEITHRNAGDFITESEYQSSLTKKNPRRRVKRNPTSGVRIVHNRLLGGWYVVRGPHQTPLNGRFDSKEAAQQWLKNAPRKNPKRRARRAGPLVRNRAGGQVRLITRRQMLAARRREQKLSPRPIFTRAVSRSARRANRARVNPAAARNRFHVKALILTNKRGAKIWNDLASFKSQAAAVDYAKALHRAHPHATIAVHKRKGP